MTPIHQKLRLPAKKLMRASLGAQLICCAILVVLSVFFSSIKTLDVLLGCVSFIVPQSFFAYWVFRYVGATKNQLVAQSFSQGMKIKLIATSVLFVVAFSQFKVHPLFFLGAYAITNASHWLASALAKD